MVGHRQHIDVDIGFLLDVPGFRLFFDVAGKQEGGLVKI